MIRVDCVQGTTEWMNARVGVFTASQFHRILTPGGKPSSQMDAYIHELIAEQVLGTKLDNASSGLMQRGTLLEEKAIRYFELQEECDTEEIGFLLRDDRRVGASPDRFVGKNGLLEIKCPAPDTHVGYLLDTEGIGYKTQVQGQLYVAEREFSKTLSFHPDMPPALVTQHRDDVFIKKLQVALDQAVSLMDEWKYRLQQDLGMFKGEKIAAAFAVAGAQ